MCLSIFATQEQISKAVAHLETAGFDNESLSLMARDDWRVHQEIGPFRSNGGIQYGGRREEFWEKAWSKMPGKGGLWVFESGPVLVAGAIVRTLCEDAADPATPPEPQTLERVLTLIGIPLSNISQYVVELTNHRFLLFVESDLKTVDRAQRALEESIPTNNALHHWHRER
jgi:hypothetical protein